MLTADFERIVIKHADKSVALRTLLRKRAVISDQHQKLLIKDINSILYNMRSDNDEAMELRGVKYTIAMTKPRTVTTTLYGHA